MSGEEDTLYLTAVEVEQLRVLVADEAVPEGLERLVRSEELRSVDE